MFPHTDKPLHSKEIGMQIQQLMFKSFDRMLKSLTFAEISYPVDLY